MAEEMNNSTATEETTGAEQQAENKTYTFEEVQALLQREGDKRVTAALKTQQKKYERELSLSKLDGDERAKAEKDARIAELEQKLRDMDIANNKSELKSVLSSRGLSAEFADIINITDDIEESQAKIDTLDKLFKAAVKAEVEKRLSATGGAPKGNGAAASETMTKEQFSKLSLSQQAEIYQNQPELYKKLTQ
jgi:hypothetical protein